MTLDDFAADVIAEAVLVAEEFDQTCPGGPRGFVVFGMALSLAIETWLVMARTQDPDDLTIGALRAIMHERISAMWQGEQKLSHEMRTLIN